jgi:predicted Rossmann fold nucleotide-binding protein DprA/Smf involved in DNA uptake
MVCFQSSTGFSIAERQRTAYNQKIKKYFLFANPETHHALRKKMIKIISGGQTGADRAALDAARERGIPHGGWLPKGRITEDGALGPEYRLEELDSYRYRDRTRKNVVESDGTLIVSYGPLSSGSALTEALAVRYNRPCLHVNMDYFTLDEAVQAVEQWLAKNTIQVLNVAGPRASSDQRIYATVRDLMLKVGSE